jgi:4-amino-4-deoxy-L-arabinose transferase-like glycosyltransferase
VLLAVGLWQRWYWGARRPAVLVMLGMVIGLTVLTRPLAAVLVPVLILGTLLVDGIPLQRLGRTAVCLLGLALVVGPWLVRNRIVAGRFVLSHQAGTVLTYYKAIEVVFWNADQTRQRYSQEAIHRVWEHFDEQVRQRWAADHGPLSADQARDIAWPQIAWGRVRTVNPVLLDQEVRRVGLQTLAEHPWATAGCWLTRCGSILTFPLTLAIHPPSDPRSLPFANLLPNLSPARRRAFALVLAGPFVLVTVLAAWRLRFLVRARLAFPLLTCLVPVVALLVATSPQEDPRFRVPMIPLLLLLAAIKPGSD